MKMRLFLLSIFSFFVFTSLSSASTIPLGAPYFCIDDTTGNSQCGNTTDANWWNIPIYKAPYNFNNISGFPIPNQFNFKWSGANLCSGEDMLIKGTLGLLFDFGATHDLSIEIYSGNQQGICTLKNIDNSRYDFSCSVQGGGDLILLFKSNTYKAPNSYQIGISKNMNIVCEPNNGTIIENNNQNTQDIINNQNSNQQQTNDRLDDIINSDISAADKELPNDDDYKKYQNAEDSLMDKVNQADTSIIDIAIDTNSSNFVWNNLTKFLQSHSLIFGTFIAILSIGIIKLALGR